MKYLLKSISVALLGACALFIPAAADARVLSPSEALGRAAESLSVSDASSRRMAATLRQVSPECVLTLEATIDNAKSPALYVFNAADNSSFIIAGADDRVRPVLAMSDEGGFDLSNLPPQMEWWLGEYTREIEYCLSQPKTLRVNLLPATETPALPKALLREPRASKAAIAPMVKTTWDQSSPYNQKCPKVSSRTTVTGCVATAMAQVMNYHQWPVKGTGSHSYTTETSDINVSLDFSSLTFDWANMANSYKSSTSTAQKTAVANLMFAAGVSVDMDYGTSESGALSSVVGPGLKTYLGYSDNTVFYGRIGVSTSEWNDIVYAALEQGYPVIYAGSGDLGGHCFVCDGYRADGLFHINWGWSGSSDGYFALNALDPESLGTGGGSGGFNYGQDITIAMRPDQPAFELPGDMSPAELYTMEYELASSPKPSTSPTLIYSVWNNTDHSVSFTLGKRLVDSNLNPVAGFSEIQYATVETLKPGYYIPKATTSVDANTMKSLADGTYYFFATYCVDPAEGYKHLPADSGGNACKIVKSGSSVKVTIEDMPEGEGGDDPTPTPTQEAKLEFLGLSPDCIAKGLSYNFTIKMRNVGEATFSDNLYAFVGTIDENTVTGYDVIDLGNCEVRAGSEVSVHSRYQCQSSPGNYVVFLCRAENNQPYIVDQENYFPLSIVDYIATMTANHDYVLDARSGTEVTVEEGVFSIQYTSAYESFTTPVVTISGPDGSSTFTLDRMSLYATGSSGATIAIPAFTFKAPAEAGAYTVTVSALGIDCDEASLGLTVTEAPAVSAISLSAESAALRAGESTVITVTTEPADAEVSGFTFTSFSESISVDEEGTVTVSDRPTLGKAWVEVSVNVNGTDISAEIGFEIVATLVEEIILSSPEVTIDAPATMQIEAIVLPELATDPTIDWTTDYNNANISAEGLLEVGEDAHAGTLTVTATAADGSGVQASIELEVVGHDGISPIIADGINATIDGTTVTVLAPEATRIALVDTSGRIAASATAKCGCLILEAPAPGAWILLIGTHAWKIVLR